MGLVLGKGTKQIRTYMVIWWGNTTRNTHLDAAHYRRDQRAKLQIRELFPDAPMPTSTEWLVRTLRALAHRTEPIIDLLPVLVRVLSKRLLSLALRIRPATRYPFLRFEPQRLVDLRYGGRREDKVALWHDVVRIL